MAEHPNRKYRDVPRPGTLARDGHWIFLFRQLREGVRRGVSIEDALDETRDGYPSVPAADIDDVMQRAYYRPDLCRIPLTDAENALRFAELARGLALHAPALGGWLIYEHGRWTLPSSNVVQELAKEVSADLRAEAKRFPGGDYQPWIKRSQSRPGIQAMLTLAESILEIGAPPEAFDTDPSLLNLMNGVLDLSCGELLPHDPTHLITTLVPVEWLDGARTKLRGSRD